MTDIVTSSDLERIMDWAKAKIHGGSEPPWAWYQYMKLLEAAETIRQGMSPTNPTVSLPQLQERQGSGRLRVVSIVPPDGVPLRQDNELLHLPT